MNKKKFYLSVCWFLTVIATGAGLYGISTGIAHQEHLRAQTAERPHDTNALDLNVVFRKGTVAGFVIATLGGTQKDIDDVCQRLAAGEAKALDNWCESKIAEDARLQTVLRERTRKDAPRIQVPTGVSVYLPDLGYTISNVVSVTYCSDLCQLIRYREGSATNEFHAWMVNVVLKTNTATTNH